MAKKIECPRLEDMAAQIEELPTLPSIVAELGKVIADPMSSMHDVEAIMQNDLSLTAKVLRLVNSAYYAIPGGVKTLDRAISYLGFDTVHQLVLSATIFSSLEHVESKDFNLQEFWKHSIGVGMASETIARIVGYKTPSDLFTSGLIHDIGKVMYLAGAPESFIYLIEEARERKQTLDEVEETLGFPKHTHLGHLLAKRWDLPLTIQYSIKHHHQKDALRRGGIGADLNQVVDIVMLGNLFVHGLNFGHSGHAQISSVPRALFDRLSLNPKALAPISKEISKSLNSAEIFLKVLGDGRKKDKRAS